MRASRPGGPTLTRRWRGSSARWPSVGARKTPLPQNADEPALPEGDHPPVVAVGDVDVAGRVLAYREGVVQLVGPDFGADDSAGVHNPKPVRRRVGHVQVPHP